MINAKRECGRQFKETHTTATKMRKTGEKWHERLLLPHSFSLSQNTKKKNVIFAELRTRPQNFDRSTQKTATNVVYILTTANFEPHTILQNAEKSAERKLWLYMYSVGGTPSCSETETKHSELITV